MLRQVMSTLLILFGVVALAVNVGCSGPGETVPSAEGPNLDIGGGEDTPVDPDDPTGGGAHQVK